MNSSEEKVSIIIPTHNREKLAHRAIRSVLDQSYDNWELIVVDDASEDNTESVAKSFHNERIFYIRSEVNLGQALATNLGIKRSSGDYIALLDDDDEWLPNKLTSQMKVYRTKPNLGMVYCGMNKIKNGREKFSYPSLRGNVLNQILVKNKITGSTSAVLIKKSVLDQIGLFDPSFRSRKDLDLFVRIAKYYEVDFANEILIKKYFDGSDRIGANFRSRQMGWLRFYTKHKRQLTESGKILDYLISMAEVFEKQGNKKVANICYRKAIKESSFNPAYYFKLLKNL